MKILITGAAGLVGRALTSYCMARGDLVFALNRTDLDIADKQSVEIVLSRARPEVVINCAAWTDVDGCELDPVRATRANADGPAFLALACTNIGALFITISTDYVFDGKKEGFYTQRDQPRPQSVYAVSKLDGERRAQTASARTIVVRSGYIFGSGGKNFLSTVLTRARRGERLRVITDCTGTPTYAVDLAEQLYRLAQIDLPGIYHIVNSGGGASFESFARALFAAANLDDRLLEPIKLDDFKRPATRPRNSKLRCLLSEAIKLQVLPCLDDAIHRFVASEIQDNATDAIPNLA